RRPEVTSDGFSIILCHEIGHHLGGFPFLSYWIADEGQADYYATQVCARLIWKDQVETNASFRASVDPLAKASCDQIWTQEADQDLCYRITKAAESLGVLVSSLDGSPLPQWSTPDLSVVDVTWDFHSYAQCRMDTYLAGALCTKTFDNTVIPGN